MFEVKSELLKAKGQISSSPFISALGQRFAIQKKLFRRYTADFKNSLTDEVCSEQEMLTLASLLAQQAYVGLGSSKRSEVARAWIDLNSSLYLLDAVSNRDNQWELVSEEIERLLLKRNLSAK
ncbi:MAG: hypothetical protein AB7O96_01530 [Pseudobdellovibrionaceae bacterium]